MEKNAIQIYPEIFPALFMNFDIYKTEGCDTGWIINSNSKGVDCVHHSPSKSGTEYIYLVKLE